MMARRITFFFMAAVVATMAMAMVMPQPQPIDAILPRDDDPPRPTENYTYDGLICRVPFWKETFKWRSLDDYQYPYLSQVQGLPHLAGGPKACSRVSCTMDTAIAWCNDSDEEMILTSWQTIIESARYIESKCVRYRSEFDKHGMLSGQLFYKENFNVYIRDERC